MSNVMKRNLPLNLDLQLFAEDPPVDPPKDDDKPPVDPPKKLELTQEEFDAKIAERLARERKKYEKYADYDELKTKLSDFEKAEEERKKAAMTEQERLQAEKDAAEAKAKEAEESAQKALSSANQRLIKAEFKAEARAAGVRADALEDAYTLADTSAVKVDDEGNVEGVKEALEALKEKKAYLFATKEPKQIGDSSNPPNDKAPQKTKEQMLKDAADKARLTGKAEDRAAYAALKRSLGV